ncbi:N-glycosylation protein EOS1 [Kalmanozyma brasiliensis GHG001]|uniref:N-glycosylation protein EOS1 n=1 Tax=Kalmanozyma brasiliensis (strain GHG001) TaxID=1365824 RepID=UPI0028683721|nr:N-glycosylation protein EOS1 [Kalmanozyma brasiliensis GHG001]KAF6767416.1 N-glycosylation protein EOS1 [Kalmanozyma brasiliensis GHG001]
MSPVAQASATADQLIPSEWTLDASTPSSPHTHLSRNASDYFDPALLAQLQSQNGSSHPELRLDGRPDPSPPVDSVFGRLSPHQTHAVRAASQSEWAQHAAHVQQTAHLLGLQRLFASRSTPHLPDLDSSYLGHDFESPPPYAPRASAHETELDRAAYVDLRTRGPHQSRLPPSSSSTWTLHDTADPPLPPPISIPSNANGHPATGPPSASSFTRPSLRARSSSRGSRSGPPSPSASFYGRRGLTSLSPFPAGLEMTSSIAHAPQSLSTPASPGIAPDSDGDEDVDSMLSFSSTRSKQKRDERRQSIAATDVASRAEASTSSLPGSSAQAQAALSRRRRSGSAGSARQLLRPRTPIHSAVTRDAADQPQLTLQRGQATTEGHINPSSRSLAGATNSISMVGIHRNPSGQALSRQPGSDNADADSGTPPVSPASDSTRADSLMSPALASTLSPGSPFSGTADMRTTQIATDNETSKSITPAAQPDEEEFSLLFKLLLHPLRILAAVPGCIGTFWLARNAWVLATQHGHVLSPGQMLVSSDGSNQFQSAKLTEHPTMEGPYRLGRRQPGSLDFAVACLWSMSTAYHALSFTTLLLRRWLLYYSILPSLIRLVALQAICWPLVRITVHVFGADQPLGAWVVIGTTTALSDVVSRWVTSNIADAPLDDEELDEEEAEEEAENEALGYLSDSRFVKSPTRANTAFTDQHPHSPANASALMGESDWDPRSGDESDAAAASFFASERERQRKQRRGGQGTRFWRAVIGGPSFAAPSRRRKNHSRSSTGPATGNSRASHLSGAGTETEMEPESDWPGYGTDHTVLGGVGGTPPSRFGTRPNQDGLRRRLGTIRAGGSPSVAASPSTMDRAASQQGMFGRRPVLPPFPFRPSTYRQGSTRFVYKDGVWSKERTGSRRNFHWDVAVWRNVVPIAVLSYLSMWILILDAMRVGS